MLEHNLRLVGRGRISAIDGRGTLMTTATQEMVRAHEAADAADVARLRALSVRERGEMIKLACEAAAVLERSRVAAGLPATGRPLAAVNLGVPEKARCPCPSLMFDVETYDGTSH